MPREEMERVSISWIELETIKQPATRKASRDMTNEDLTSSTKKKEKKSVGDLASRITIAGIEDVVKAETRVEKYTFIVGMLICAIAMSYSSILIGMNYMTSDDSVVENRVEVLARGQVTFPNITICLPLMKIVESRFTKSLVIPEKVRRRMDQLNFTADEVGQSAQRIMSELSGEKQTENPAKQVLALKVIDATLQTDPKLIVDAVKPPCELNFYNCTFGGKQFDCCSIASYVFSEKGSCWHFDINKIDRSYRAEMEIPPIDSLNTAYNGLMMDIVIDKRSVTPDDDNISADGFLLLVDTSPSLLASPEVIPFDAEAHVILAEPILLDEIDQCQEMDNIPKLNRFSEYDPAGVICTIDRLLDLILEHVGCDGIPFLSFAPRVETLCTAQMITFGTQLVSGKLAVPPELEGAFAKYMNNGDEVRKLIAGIMCKPLCGRWTYPIFSTSYGYLQYSPDARASRVNTSMTRLKIYFPDDAYYEKRTESRPSSNLHYMAFCEIGGVWGVYLGFSIVTFLQLVVYSSMICWMIRKRRRAVATVSGG